MKIQVVIEYKGNFYNSTEDTVTDEEAQRIVQHLEDANESSSRYLSITTERGQSIFPHDVLKESIIHIIKNK